MKKRNTLLCVLGAATMLLASCGGEATPMEVLISNEGNRSTLKVGETLQYQASVLPEGTNQKVEWSVVNIDGEATISNAGLLTATKEGNVEVVAASYIDKGIKGTLRLKIEGYAEIKPTSIKALAPETELSIGGSITLGLRVTPENASKSCTFSSSDEKILTVSDTGVVTGVTEGTVKVTVTSKLDSTVTDEITFVVKKSDVTEPGGEILDWKDVSLSNTKQFFDAKNDTQLKVEGKCVFVEEPYEGKYAVYLQNGKGGFYITDLVPTQKIELNKNYVVGGFKYKDFKNTHKLNKVSLVEETTKEISIETTKLTPAQTQDTNELSNYLFGNVELSKITIPNIKTETEAYSLSCLYEGKQVGINIDPRLTGEAEFAKINEKLNSIPFGYPIKLNAMLRFYGYGKPKASFDILKASDLTILTLTDKEAIEIAASAIDLPNFLTTGTNILETLPTSIKGHEGLTINYDFDGTIITKDGFVNGAELPTLAEFTATFKKGSETLEKKYKVSVDGTKTLSKVHTFDLEDALPAKQYDNSESKPSYKEGSVELGTPTKAKWNLRNTLISQTTSDVREGEFSMRMQMNNELSQSGRIELLQNMEFNVIEFAFATYGNDSNGAELAIAYSNDGGTTWTEDAVIYTVNSGTLETVKFTIPELTAYNRVAIQLKPSLGKRVNVDNIRLYK